MENLSRKTYRKALVLLPLLYLIASAAQPLLMGPGLNNPEPMGAYLNGMFPDETPTGSTGGPVTYSVDDNAFPGIFFTDPVDMVELPGMNEFLVVGLQGHIWRVIKSLDNPSKHLLLDISPNTVVYRDGGMLGIVLHPEFGQPGSPNAEYIYVFYRYTPVAEPDGFISSSPSVNGYMRLSRFNYVIGTNSIDPNSEFVLLQSFDRHDWHNGGDMFFGDDGFLYLVIGDEGASNDSFNVAQQIDKWLFSGVLRIDVDQKGGSISHPIRRQPQNAGSVPSGWPNSFTQGYYIPSDNPWLDSSGGILEEFYAIGTRSPHRMTFDPPTGDIWVGDVGQSAKEEVTIVKKGDNLQWPYREGDQTGPKAKPNPLIGVDAPPIYAYGRSLGGAVIGGFVYRGNRYPELAGKYIFADHLTQNVSVLTKDPQGGPATVDFLLNVPQHGEGSKDGISSFYEDSEGIIYVLDLYSTGSDQGKIRSIVRSGSGVLDPPSRLSDLGVFTDMSTLATASGIIPYDVNAPLWSDRATKKRWVALPNDGTHDSPLEQITFDAENNWQFPPGTVFIKHFDLPTDERDPSITVKLETRFLVFTSVGDAYGVTYRWNDAGTEAFLIDISAQEFRDIQVIDLQGNPSVQTWDFPSRQQCMSCHNPAAGHALGIKSRQLNKDYLYPTTGINANQLETWNHLGMFHEDIGPTDQLPVSAYLLDANHSLEFRIRSYIDANCGFCHRPGGVNGAFDGRSATPFHDQDMVNTPVASSSSSPGNVIIAPGDLNGSELWLRDNSVGSNKMPPIGRRLVDPDYVNALSNWISSIDQNGPETIPEGWYNLQARHSNKVATVENASTQIGAGIIQTSLDNLLEQEWYLEPMGNNKYRIRTGHSNMVMAQRSLQASTGIDIVQQPWSGEQHQLWYFEDTENGFYQISNAYSGLALEVSSGSSSDGEPLFNAILSGALYQQWKPVAVSNASPVALFTAQPPVGTVPLLVSFDGSGSSDSDGSIVNYSWDFGDGNTGSGITIDHPYQNVGSYNASLTVTDNDGLTNTTSLIIQVDPASQCPAPPSEWEITFVGDGDIGGEVCYDNGAFTIESAGVDIWNQSDAFRFVHQPLSCTGEIIARVNSLANTTHSWAKAGVMIRESLAADSRHTSMVASASNGVSFQYRTVTGGTSNSINLTDPWPIWVRMQREGDVLTGSHSDDGINWTIAGTITLQGMSQDVVMGLAVTAHNAEVISTGEFDNVTATNLGCGSNQSPTAVISAGATSGNAPLTVDFDGSGSSDPDGSIVSYAWDFGDGNSSTTDIVSHNYTIPGTYTASLTVTDDVGATDQETVTIQVDPALEAPVAQISADILNGPAPLTVNFDGSGSTDNDGTIQTFNWDFGDGTSNSGQSVSHTFNDVGTFTVILTVTDDDDLSDFTELDIVVEAPLFAPVAQFTAQPSSGDAPLTVDFDASGSSDSDGNITDYSWDFGDDNNGSGITIQHIYSTTGAYAATLTVTDDDGLIDTHQITINVGTTNASPVALFTAQPPVGTVPLLVSFDGSGSSDSDGSIVNYSWDFGDGNTGSGITIDHTYQNVGSYNASLTVTDNDGLTNTASLIIQVDPASQCPAPPSEWEITFVGDGDIGGEVCYDNGAFTIESAGVDIWNQSDAFRFVHQPLSCTGEIIARVNSLANTTHSWAKAGVMIRESLAADSRHTSMVASASNGVSFQYRTVTGGTSNSINLTDPWPIWVRMQREGDVLTGSHSDDGINWTIAGTITLQGMSQDVVMGLAVTAHNAEVISTGEFDNVTATNLGCGSNQSPTAVISAGATSGNAPLTVDFDGSGSSDPDGSIVGYAWDFGDGASNSGLSVSHTYNDVGSYTVRLTVTDNDNLTDFTELMIDVEAPLIAPVAQFTAQPTSGDAPLTVNFDASGSSDSDGSIVNYAWDFGDGNNGSGIIEQHIYSSSGSYTAILTVTDNDGLVDTHESTITVGTALASPVAQINADPIAGEAPLLVSFDGSGSSDSDGTIVSYNWDYGDGNTGSGISVNHTYQTEGSYDVTLTVMDNDGLNNATSVTIVVDPEPVAPLAQISAQPTSGPAPLTVNFDGSGSSDSDGSIVSYNWDFGDNENSTLETTSHVYSTPGNYTAVLTVTDDQGLEDMAQITIQVDLPLVGPMASISAQPTEGVAPLTVNFDGSGSTDSDGTIVNYAWNFGDGTSNSGASVDHNYTVAGTYNVVLTVTDNDNLTDQAQITIQVSQGPQPPVAQIVSQPTIGSAPLTVNFDGSGSTDSDGFITEYAWDFGNGATAAGQQISHTYTEPGSYSATLTVTDNDGQTNSDQVNITVDPPLPDPIWLEAECGVIGSNWVEASSNQASGNAYVVHPEGSGNQNNENLNVLEDPANQVILQFYALQGRYHIFFRMNAPSAKDDSFWVQLDGGEWWKFTKTPSNSNLRTNGFEWKKLSDNGTDMPTDLSEGLHTLIVAYREDGAELDKVVLTPEDISPVDLGGPAGNCNNNLVNLRMPPATNEIASICGEDLKPWNVNFVGGMDQRGAACANHGIFTVQASGKGLKDYSDQFNFVYQTLPCDGELIAEVRDLTNVQDGGQAGVMIRENLNSRSPYVSMAINSSKELVFSYRDVGGHKIQVITQNVNAPGWLRVKRQGEAFTGYFSEDGQIWTLAGTTNMEGLYGDLMIGITTASGKRKIKTTAIFGGVVISAEGCGMITDQMITSGINVSSKENTSHEQLDPRVQVTALVYPNPVIRTRQQLIVDIKNPEMGAVACQLFDLNGRVIMNKLIEMETVQTFVKFDLSGEATGVYYMRIKKNNWERVTKVIVH